MPFISFRNIFAHVSFYLYDEGEVRRVVCRMVNVLPGEISSRLTIHWNAGYEV